MNLTLCKYEVESEHSVLFGNEREKAHAEINNCYQCPMTEYQQKDCLCFEAYESKVSPDNILKLMQRE